MALDAAAKGLDYTGLASKVQPPVAVSTIARFVSGESQTAPMAKRIAKALGHSVRRYIMSAETAVSA